MKSNILNSCVAVFVNKLFRNGQTDFYEILVAYRLDLRIKLFLYLWLNNVCRVSQYVIKTGKLLRARHLCYKFRMESKPTGYFVLNSEWPFFLLMLRSIPSFFNDIQSVAFIDNCDIFQIGPVQPDKQILLLYNILVIKKIKHEVFLFIVFFSFSGVRYVFA